MAKPKKFDPQASAQAMAKGEVPPTIVYEASGGRKTFFAFAILLLLPFFTSLPAMLYSRLVHGLWFDTVGFAIFAATFAVVMFLIFVELLMSLRMRVVLGPTEAKMTLPSGRGPTPILRYRSETIPYTDIESIETRREIYGGRLAPVILKGARLTKKNGEHVKLGYVNESNVDPTFPYPEIAKHIADRARLPVVDRGNVWRSARQKFLGIRSRAFGGLRPSGPIEDAELEKLNHSHHTAVLTLIGAFAVLLLIGIANDMASDDPIGLGAAPLERHFADLGTTATKYAPTTR
jgi:hypothetical protein